MLRRAVLQVSLKAVDKWWASDWQAGGRRWRPATRAPGRRTEVLDEAERQDPAGRTRSPLLRVGQAGQLWTRAADRRVVEQDTEAVRVRREET
jgi:hypothetical protein